MPGMNESDRVEQVRLCRAGKPVSPKGIHSMPGMNESDRVEQVRLSSRRACESQEDSQHVRQ